MSRFVVCFVFFFFLVYGRPPDLNPLFCPPAPDVIRGRLHMNGKENLICPGNLYMDSFDSFPVHTGLSSLGVPGVPWHTQILADQLTLFQPGGTDYAHLITTGTPGFSDLPTALILYDY